MKAIYYISLYYKDKDDISIHGKHCLYLVVCDGQIIIKVLSVFSSFSAFSVTAGHDEATRTRDGSRMSGRVEILLRSFRRCGGGVARTGTWSCLRAYLELHQ